MAILAFAHAYAELKPKNVRCFASFTSAQWPRWIGCAMAAHENPAGGLLAASGALFAAWLAYASLQRQIRDQDLNRRRIQLEAKEMAKIAISHSVHAAASTLKALRNALAAELPLEIQAKDKIVDLGITQLAATLNHYSLRNVAQDLAVEDRLHFLMVLMTLTTFSNLNDPPSPLLAREQRLTNNIGILKRIGPQVALFDDELAAVFERDSQV